MSSSYRVYPLAVPANGEVFLDVTGTYLAVLTATDPDGIQIGIGEDEAYFWPLGLTVETRDPFRQVRVRDTSGAPNLIQVAVGVGRLTDNRLTASAPLELAAGGGLALLRGDVQAINARLANDREKRAALTTLEGASHYWVANSSATWITALANTAGCIIRFLELESRGGANAQITIDGNVLVSVTSTGDSSLIHTERDIFVPAGQAIAATANNNARAVMYAETL